MPITLAAAAFAINGAILFGKFHPMTLDTKLSQFDRVMYALSTGLSALLFALGVSLLLMVLTSPSLVIAQFGSL